MKNKNNKKNVNSFFCHSFWLSCHYQIMLSDQLFRNFISVAYTLCLRCLNYYWYRIVADLYCELFRFASISWFQVVSKSVSESVSELPFFFLQIMSKSSNTRDTSNTSDASRSSDRNIISYTSNISISNWNNASKEGSECNESNACYMQVIQESQVMQVNLPLPLAHLWIHFRVKFYREIDIELCPEAFLSFHCALIVRGKWKNGNNVSSSGKISAFSEW